MVPVTCQPKKFAAKKPGPTPGAGTTAWSGGWLQNIGSREKTAPRELVLGLHHLYPYPPRNHRYRRMYFPIPALKKALTLLVDQGFSLRPGEIRVGLDDNSFHDQQEFFKLGRWCRKKWPAQCLPGAWEINISGYRYKPSTRELLKAFIDWGGRVHTHTVSHQDSRKLSLPGLVWQYGRGIRAILRATGPEYFRLIPHPAKPDAYFIQWTGKLPAHRSAHPVSFDPNRLIGGVAPFGVLAPFRVRYLNTRGLPVFARRQRLRDLTGKFITVGKGTRIFAGEYQLYHNEIEDGVHANGVQRLVFSPWSLTKTGETWCLDLGSPRLENRRRVPLDAIRKMLRAPTATPEQWSRAMETPENLDRCNQRYGNY